MSQNVDLSKRRILVVDDDSDSIEIVSEALRWEGYDVHGIESGEKALAYIKDWQPHAVLLDINMPGLSGLETLKRIRDIPVYIAVIFLSGNASTDALIEGLDAGADDYVIKPFDPLELLARVRAQLRIKDLTDQLQEANQQLKELADSDDLTGLFNMRSIYNKLDFELERAKRFKRSVSVIMMDMDHFKTVNDGHDHLFGSFVLAEVGKIIKSNVRTVDLAARYGGDEFLIILTEVTRDGVINFCSRLRKTIEETTFKSGSDQINLTASIGFAITDPKGAYNFTSRDLIRKADRALYDAKDAGRNCIKFFDLAECPIEVESHMLKKTKA